MAIQENPYMQYLLGLSKFTEKPVFVPELFVLIRKRLDQDFFKMPTLILSKAGAVQKTMQRYVFLGIYIISEGKRIKISFHKACETTF